MVVWKWVGVFCGLGAREDQPALTFIARDQRPAFGLEVGRDDVTEAVGQDVVCFIVDVLPAVGTGLQDRERFRAGQSGQSQSKAQQYQAVLWEESGREGLGSHVLSHPPHQQTVGACSGVPLGGGRNQQTYKQMRSITSAGEKGHGVMG